MASGVKLENGNVNLRVDTSITLPPVDDVFDVEWTVHSANPSFDTVTIFAGTYVISGDSAECEITTKPALREFLAQHPDLLLPICISNGVDDGYMQAAIINGSGGPICTVAAANLGYAPSYTDAKWLSVTHYDQNGILIDDFAENQVIWYFIGLSAVMAKATAVSV